MNSLAEIKQNLRDVRSEVQRLTGLSDLSYCRIQYERGCEYLSHQCSGDQWGVRVMEETTLYWNWWKLQWHKRDQLFLQELCGNECSAWFTKWELRNAYDMHHRLNTIISDAQAELLDKSYSQLAETLIKQNQTA